MDHPKLDREENRQGGAEMRKIICDRCKAEMAEDDERFFVTDGRSDPHGYRQMPTLDLCPSCNAKLLMFLAGVNLEEQHGEQMQIS